MSKEDRLDRLNLVLARDSDTEGDTFDTWDVELDFRQRASRQKARDKNDTKGMSQIETGSCLCA